MYYSLFHRRRRKHKFFLFIFLILILSSYICYLFIEIYSDNNDIQLYEQRIPKFEKENDLKREHPIFSQYIENPYNIDVLSIIDEANRKYQEKATLANKTKYLVYSCPFMCGGRTKLIFNNNKIF
jgi:hypothetical protein